MMMKSLKRNMQGPSSEENQENLKKLRDTIKSRENLIDGTWKLLERN